MANSFTAQYAYGKKNKKLKKRFKNLYNSIDIAVSVGYRRFGQSHTPMATTRHHLIFIVISNLPLIHIKNT